jgi:subtilase family serine protease
VGIVDAYDDPNAESDLAIYRSTYGLSPCTSANGCFKKVNQTGGTTYPTANVGWAEEISLDLDMVSAICPNCHILLVEANDSLDSDLGASVDKAVALGATEVSNSYAGGEFSGEASDADYNHPGVPITVATGDGGYSAGTTFPSSSPYVTAVGGTVLNINAGYWDETVWSGAQSGCSVYASKQSWQVDSGCSNRTTADVSAVATNVAVYDTYGTSGTWFTFSGTSVSTPIIASVYALAGNGSTISNASYAYSHTDGFFDIVSGNNGSCSGSYLCTAALGYDGPTGLGTPDGTSGF